MNTSNSISKTIINDFEKLFSLSSEDKIEERAQMISFLFLSEFEKVLVERGWTKKHLAKRIGTSPSFLTQLFRGDRLLSLKMIAKIEQALNVEIRISLNDILSSAESKKRVDGNELMKVG